MHPAVLAASMLSVALLLTRPTVAPTAPTPHAWILPAGSEPQRAPGRGLGGSWWDRTDPGPRGRVPRSRFYAIRSDLPVEETRRYADLLDTMYQEYSRLMQGLRPRGAAHLDVFMFATEQDYLDTLRTKFGAAGTGSGGMFFVGPKGAGLAFFTGGLPRSRIEHVIRHEGFHQVAHIYFEDDLPPWANEGLAEYFGESVVVDGTVLEGQMTERTVSRVKRLIEDERVIPFEDLLSRDLRAWNGSVARGTAEAQYAQSTSMVNFLLWGEGGRLSSRFSAYLRSLNEGRDAVSAFRLAFGGTDDRALDDFERRWRAFAAAQSPGSVRAALDRLTFLAEGIMHLRAKGIHPVTMEALKSELVKSGFSLTLGAHGAAVTLAASDDSLYSIPPDQLQDPRRPPTIEFLSRAPKPRKSGGAAAPDSNGDAGAGDGEGRPSGTAGKPANAPPPPELSTRSLRPRDIKVSWKKGPDGHWSAEIGLK